MSQCGRVSRKLHVCIWKEPVELTFCLTPIVHSQNNTATLTLPGTHRNPKLGFWSLKKTAFQKPGFGMASLL
jgi:hypothetical protein